MPTSMQWKVSVNKRKTNRPGFGPIEHSWAGKRSAMCLKLLRLLVVQHALLAAIVLLRDAWMHSIDPIITANAASQPLRLTEIPLRNCVILAGGAWKQRFMVEAPTKGSAGGMLRWAHF